jgi:eukaryotic-like serine/threonine-protein kinase
MNVETWQRLKALFHTALEMEPADRAAFLANACDGDADVRRQVEELLSAHDEAGPFLASSALVDAGMISMDEVLGAADQVNRVGQPVGPYEIIREIGHGGMGSVFLAVRADDHYRKQVAIKLVNRGMDTDTILRRFMMERQILANLEHPNIAGLLDGGSTADGLPYFVMEYIEGRPITEYCDARRFTTTQRLELFRKVCGALQYAHQNLIVHRDIKPSNILVTAEGVPKLLDFGIAKLLSPGWAAGITEATASMVRLMTPQYASPEQLRGLSITTASDVYSLGLVLYELLSGHHAYRLLSRRPEDMAEAILREEPEKPSTAAGREKPEGKNATDRQQQTTDDRPITNKTNPQFDIRNAKSLRGDLDNIVLKALRKEPHRRYASVQEFSEDIRRHLEGLPVTASPDTLAYRTSKFVHRHRVSVLASVFILLSLLAGIATTTWQAHRANLERAKAERRFNETRKLSKYLMTDVFDSLTLLSGATQVQKDLTQNALRYLDKLAQEESDDVVLLGELAAIYIRLGQVQNSSFHDTRAALESFQKAVDLQRKRVSRVPNDVAIKRDLIFALGHADEVLEHNERTEEYLRVASEIQNLRQEVINAQPDNIRDIFALALDYLARGRIFNLLKRREEARSDYQNAFRLTTQAITLSKDRAQTPQEKIDLSFRYVYLGEIYALLEDWQNAVASNRTACEIAETVWRENPALMQAMRNTASSHRSLAAALERIGDHQGALENYQYSLRAVSEAAANNRDSAEFRHGEAAYTIKVGAALHKVGESTRAIEMVKRGLEIDRKNLAQDKDRAASVTYSYETFQPAAEFFVAIGKREEAIAVYKEWAHNIEKLRESVPREPDLVWTSASIYARIGDVQSAFNPETKSVAATNRAKLGDARRWYQKSLTALKELRELGGATPNVQDVVSATEQKLAQCETQLK